MALNATIHKAELHIADNDRGYYGSHAITLARHPSETDERMMVRLLAYALYEKGDDLLSFTRGLSDNDEPDLWRRDLTGMIEQWVEVGLPDARRLLKACGRAQEVIVFAYGRGVATWWLDVAPKVARARGLKVFALPIAGTQTLAALAERTMTLNVNIQDGTIWVSGNGGEASLEMARLNPA